MKTAILSANYTHRSLGRAALILVFLLITCFVRLPTAQAVNPPPDGGYPDRNTAEGENALQSNTTGRDNTAVGYKSLSNNTRGRDNTANGANALSDTTTGRRNTAIGHNALLRNTTGYSNTGIGHDALLLNTTGHYNTAVGSYAGEGQTTGSGNVYIGTGMSGVAGESNTCYIASIFGQTAANGIPVLINPNNKLGTAPSSKRFKEDIRPMGGVSETLFALRPVAFHYNKEIDPAGISQFGLVAEDVEKVSPDLVIRDKEGKPYSVRYDQVNAMLLNEFLKEHRRDEEQGATITDLKSIIVQQEKAFQSNIAELRRQIEALTAGLHEVKSQVETTHATTRSIANSQ